MERDRDGDVKRLIAVVAVATLAGLAFAPSAHAQRHRRRHHGGTAHPHTDGAATTPAGDTGDEGDEATPATPAPTPAPATTTTTTTARVATVLRAPSTSAPVAAEHPPADRVETPQRLHLAAFDAQLGPRLFGRHLSFTDDLFQQLRPYDVDFAPSVAGSLEWYPAAHFTQGIPAYFGIVATGDYAIGLASHDAQMHSFPTIAYGFSGALRVRLPLGPVDAGLLLGYGRQAFILTNTHAAGDDGIPSVDYQFIRVGASARLAVFSRLAVMANVGYLIMLSTGEIGSAAYFPRLFCGGVEAGVGFAVPIVSGFEVRLTGDYRRFFYTMNPMRNDPYIAGGALDEYWSATLAAAFRR